MKIAISNLAFAASESDRAYERLAAAGIAGIEIAPSRLQAWEQLSGRAGADEKRRLTAYGLEASSLQAIFYGRPELQLLGDEDAFLQMREHVVRLGEYADALGATVAVFGAPRHRNRGSLGLSEALEIGAERLSLLGTALAGSGLVLGMEPIPAHYNGDFLQSFAEVLTMVEAVDHPAIGLHLDTGCVLLNGDSISDAIFAGSARLVHFQAAEPDLGAFDRPSADHPGAAAALNAVGYDRWVSIEMLEQGPDSLAAAEQAAIFVLNTYRPGESNGNVRQ